MTWKSLVVSFTFALFLSFPNGATSGSTRPNLSAAEIVAKNVAARGGLQAWRAVKTISETGKLGAGGNRRETIPGQAALPNNKRAGRQQPLASSPRLAEEAQLPFVLEMERPRKIRFELQFSGQTAIQVYDGTNGWKLRPFLNRREVESYTADELDHASMQADLDGPLVDYATKGTKIELVGMEKVEDRDTYKLKLTTKNGHATHVWIDAQTFLEAKIEGQPRRLDGVYHPVETYYRDYRQVNGLQIPYVLETKVLPVAQTAQGVRNTPVPPEKIILDKVVVNPNLEESRFSKPEIGVASKAN